MDIKAKILAYLEYVRLPIDDGLLDMLLLQIEQIKPCMENHGYDENTQALIIMYLIGLMVNAGTDGQISSHSAHGVSQSFNYNKAQYYRGTLGLLNTLDPHGCATGLIPPSPERTPMGFLYVSPGGCSHE